MSSSLSAAESQALAAALNRLETALKAKAPIQFSRLAGGASSSQINQLRASLNGSTVEALEKWFQWHNGTSSGGCSLLPLGYVLSIDESLGNRKLEESIAHIDRLRNGAIKIMDDGAGDGFFLDTTSKTPFVFYHMLEDPAPTYYGTLDEFVEFIAIGFEKGILYEDKAGNFAYHETQYTTYESAHLANVSKPLP